MSHAEKSSANKLSYVSLSFVQHLIHVRELRRSYGDVRAVDGVDFEVRPGEIFAMLGPNGAGKSTTVEILEGLRQRDGGIVSVLGFDPATEPEKLKSRIGVALQSSEFPDKIRVRELIDLYGRLYKTRPDAKALLERFDLTDKAGAFYGTLSGGQKQKMALVLALINDPQLIFLDEPTNGLDARTRRSVHDWLRELRSEGRTIFLTTHYIHEAEQLSDRVAILTSGRIVRQGALMEISLGLRLESELRIRTEKPFVSDAVGSLESVRSYTSSDGFVVLKVDDPARAVSSLVRLLDSIGNRLTEIAISMPTLEDMYLELTGERVEGEEGEPS